MSQSNYEEVLAFHHHHAMQYEGEWATEKFHQRAVAELERLASLEKEVAAWRERFPNLKYRPQDDCVALK